MESSDVGVLIHIRALLCMCCTRNGEERIISKILLHCVVLCCCFIKVKQGRRSLAAVSETERTEIAERVLKFSLPASPGI